MSRIETAIRQMEDWANDASHGYDQVYRWGEKGDYDCSSAVIQAWERAGVPVRSDGATYTGNMLGVFKNCGFKDITSQINLANGSGLVRGDVLLNTVYHTAMYCGNGKEVEASINEKGTVAGGAPGDQTGKEFLIRSYRNYPWTHVLRYTEACSSAGGTGTKPTVDSANRAPQTATEGAQSCLKAVAGTYIVTAGAGLNVRNGAGTSKKILVAIPKGTRVTCFGYYTLASNIKWLYVQFTYRNVLYIGFCSSEYLTRC